MNYTIPYRSKDTNINDVSLLDLPIHRCSLGKLDQYLGQGAVERDIYVWPEINFCTNPEAICDHERTNELRWVLGMLEWSDRVQSYADLDSGWNYSDELKKFVDDGIDDEGFINAVINIVTKKCHDDSCSDQWILDDDNYLYVDKRRDNFRRIIYQTNKFADKSQHLHWPYP